MCVPAIGMIAGIASSVVGAIGAMQQANAQAAQAEYNAKVAEINARTARQAGLAEADQKEDEYQALRGRQRAQAAASGIRGDAGSAALIINDATYQDQYLDTANIIWGRETEAIGQQNKAKDLKMQAKAYKQAGVTSAFGTILGGFAGIAKQGNTIEIS